MENKPWMFFSSLETDYKKKEFKKSKIFAFTNGSFVGRVSNLNIRKQYQNNQQLSRREENRESCNKHWILDDHTDLKANVEISHANFSWLWFSSKKSVR